MGHADVVLADMLVVAADVLGEAPVFLPELLGRRGEGGDEYIHVIGAAAEHSAGRVRPDLHHVAAMDQIVHRVRLDERESDALAAGRREKGHPVNEHRVVLHVVQLGEAPRRGGEARIGRDVLHPFAVDEQLASVPQRLQKLLASTNGHPGFLSAMPRYPTPCSKALRVSPSHSPASRSRAARSTWSRQPLGRPTGLPSCGWATAGTDSALPVPPVLSGRDQASATPSIAIRHPLKARKA